MYFRPHAARCFLALVASLIAPVVSQAQTKWFMPTPFQDTNYHTINAKAFAADVLEASGGKLEIVVHSNATLFKMPEIKRAVVTGQAQIGDILLASYGNEDPFFEVDGIPFLVQGFDEARKLYDLTRPYIERRLAKQGLMPLYYVVWPGQAVYAKTELLSGADFKGLKFRTYNPVTSRFAELLGAVPITVQAPEISQAFATGIANTMITSGSTGIDTQAWEYAKYYYDLRAMHNKSLTFVNAAAFKSLSPELQKVLLEAAARAEKRGWEMAAKSGDESAKVLASKGLLVQPGSTKLVSDLKVVGAQIATEWSKKSGPDGVAVLEALKASK